MGYVETKIGMPGDKIMVDGEMNTIAPDAKEAEEPPPPEPPKKGAKISLILPLDLDHAEGAPVKIIKAEEKKKEEKKEKKKEEKKEKKKEEKKKEKKEEKKEVEEATVLTEPAKKGDTFIYVETKIGMPGDKIMVDGEMNTIAPDAKEAKEPPPPEPPKKGAK